MSGSHIGTLEVVLNETNVIWSLSGRQKNEWLQAEIKLPIGAYSLEFSANRSIFGRSSCDIALDDIYLQGQPCNFIIFFKQAIKFSQTKIKKLIFPKKKFIK